MFGGVSYPSNAEPGGIFNDTWVYSPATNIGPCLTRQGPQSPGKANHGVRPFKPPAGHVGTDGADAVLTTPGHDPVADTWTELKPAGTLPAGRSDQAMAYVTSSARLIMFGGWLASGPNPGTINDHWTYDPETNTWT